MAKDIPRKPSGDPAAHRELVVVEPPMSGRDVANLHRAIRARLMPRGLDDDVAVPAHDKFTHASAVAAAEVGYWLGLQSSTYLHRVRVDGEPRLSCTIGAQRVIREPMTRDETQLQRAKARQVALDDGPRLKHLADEMGRGRMEDALRWAVKQEGTRERPPGSNWGPKVSDWIKLTGYTGPVPWCFAPGTLVNTPDGLRRIETISAGDLVMDAHDGVAVVGAAHARHASDRFRLRAYGVDQTIVSGEHPYIARRRLESRPGYPRAFGEPEWVDARDLSRGDLIAQPILGGDLAMDEAKAYVIGRYLADGWGVQRRARSGRSSRVERFICDSHDKRDEIVSALDAAGLGYSERVYPTVVQFALRVDSRELLAGCGLGARTKRLPPHALMWHEGARRALMDGYLDGDGCSYRQVVTANSISRELVLGMAQIARSVGHVVTMRAEERSDTTVIAGRHVNQATARYTMRFQPDGVPDGHQHYITGVDEHCWVPVRSIDEVEPGPVHNLTVSGESTFIADGYAVHNCGCWANAVCIKGGVPNGAGWIGFTPAIIRHAQQGLGGWRWVGPARGERGNLALFDTPGGDIAVHVGVVLERHGSSSYRTIEGNTGGSNPADGGMVAIQDRSTSGRFRIVGFAVPPWR